MIKSKTRIEKQKRKKRNLELVETITLAKKNSFWIEIASILSGSTKKRLNINVGEINKKVKEGEKVIVVGKVLSMGEIDKKISVIALGFSEKAKEKIIGAKGKISFILDEIKQNPEMKGVKILK